MGGMMRRMGQAAKKAFTPVAFAALLPMCSPAMALPRKTVKPKVLSAKKRHADPYPFFAAMKVSSGKMILDLLCKDADGKFLPLERIKKDAIAEGRNRSERDAVEKISVESRILAQVASTVSFSKEDRLKAAVASVFYNSEDLLLLHRSKKAVHSEVVGNFLNIIKGSGLRKLADSVNDWIKNNKGERISLYKGIQICSCL